jgi:hypothetical protein
MVLQSAFIYAPPPQQLSGSASLDLRAWALCGAAALSVVPVIELEKRLRRRA